MATVANDIESTHPDYDAIVPDWQLVSDGYKGERAIKQRSSVYLPTTSGQRALGLGKTGGTFNEGQELYNAYLLRANYPALVRDIANALVGVMNREPPVIELPDALEDMLLMATARGEPLAALLRRIQLYQLLFGRTGILADVDASRDLPYLIDYPAKRIINWDDEPDEIEDAQRRVSLVVLDETRNVRDEFTWEEKEKFRALRLNEAGKYEVVISDDGNREAAIMPSIQGTTLEKIPFVFINSADLTPQPGDVPLLGLARLALTIYRGDADYRQALFMQGQDTLVVIGEDTEDGKLIVGAGAHINIPNPEGDAKFIGVDGQGLPEMREAQATDYERALNYGLQLMSGAGAEAAETLKIRVAARTADLVNIAMTSAAGLTEILQTCAEWVGADPDDVKVEPNTDFIDETMGATELLGFMNAKSRGAPLSTKSIHALMRKGDVTQLSFDDEIDEIADEPTPDDRTGLGEETEVDENGNPIEQDESGQPGSDENDDDEE